MHKSLIVFITAFLHIELTVMRQLLAYKLLFLFMLSPSLIF